MPSFNTLKTTAGYFATLLRRWFPFLYASNKLERIYNFLRIDDSITTSGQPTAAQFELIKTAGYGAVINLAPHSAENALPNEQETLSRLGLRYIHIPVDFKNPTETDFVAFCQALNDVRSKQVWVHCAANMRVSAFVYRYRWQIRGEDRQIAAQDLHKIWRPSGVWKAFSEGG